MNNLFKAMLIAALSTLCFTSTAFADANVCIDEMNKIYDKGIKLHDKQSARCKAAVAGGWNTIAQKFKIGTNCDAKFIRYMMNEMAQDMLMVCDLDCEGVEFQGKSKICSEEGQLNLGGIGEIEQIIGGIQPASFIPVADTSGGANIDI